MFKSIVFCTLILSLTAVSAYACNDIYYLRDGRKIHTESSTDKCLETAHGIVESPLKDGIYHLKNGGSGVVKNGCWSLLQKGTTLQSGEVIYTAIFTNDGETPYLLKDESFMLLPDGSYMTNQKTRNKFSVTGGVIDEYGGFDQNGQLIFEDRN